MHIFILLISAVLIVLTFFVALGLSLEKKRANINGINKDYQPFISIIIPARNEAENLPRLFTSLENQSYKNLEIILIDDRSEDQSLKLMNNFHTASNLKIKVIANTESPGAFNPKVNVLLKGIEQAEGELFVFTDADCEAGECWAELLVEAFSNLSTGVVCGMLTLTGENNVLCRFQNFDHFFRMLFAFGAIGLGKPIGCFGNNLAIRKETYLSVGGYECLLHSATEDAELISKVNTAGKYKIRALFNDDSFIETVHKRTWNEHTNQAVRWAAGAVFSENRFAQTSFIALMIITAFCLLSIPLGILNPVFFIFPSVMYGFLFLSSILLGFTGPVNTRYWKGLFVSVLLYPFIYVQSFFIAVLTRTINWKGTIISWKKRIK